MRERRATESGDVLRITAQFRVRNGMVYELREHGARLTLLMTTPEDRSAEWNCEASSGALAPISERGATRGEALQRTCEAWRANGLARGLPTFDWDAVTRALATVRAI